MSHTADSVNLARSESAVVIKTAASPKALLKAQSSPGLAVSPKSRAKPGARPTSPTVTTPTREQRNPPIPRPNGNVENRRWSNKTTEALDNRLGVIPEEFGGTGNARLSVSSPQRPGSGSGRSAVLEDLEATGMKYEPHREPYFDDDEEYDDNDDDDDDDSDDESIDENFDLVEEKLEKLMAFASKAVEPRRRGQLHLVASAIWQRPRSQSDSTFHFDDSPSKLRDASALVGSIASSATDAETEWHSDHNKPSKSRIVGHMLDDVTAEVTALCNANESVHAALQKELLGKQNFTEAARSATEHLRKKLDEACQRRKCIKEEAAIQCAQLRKRVDEISTHASRVRELQNEQSNVRLQLMNRSSVSYGHNAEVCIAVCESEEDDRTTQTPSIPAINPRPLLPWTIRNNSWSTNASVQMPAAFQYKPQGQCQQGGHTSVSVIPQPTMVLSNSQGSLIVSNSIPNNATMPTEWISTDGQLVRCASPHAIANRCQLRSQSPSPLSVAPTCPTLQPCQQSVAYRRPSSPGLPAPGTFVCLRPRSNYPPSTSREIQLGTAVPLMGKPPSRNARSASPHMLFGFKGSA